MLMSTHFNKTTTTIPVSGKIRNPDKEGCYQIVKDDKLQLHIAKQNHKLANKNHDI